MTLEQPEADTRTPAARAAADLRAAQIAAREALEDLEAEIDQVGFAAAHALRTAEAATAEQRSRAERAEDALRALGVAPGSPIEWRGHAVDVSITADAHHALVRVLAGLDANSVAVFGRVAHEHAIVAFQPSQAELDARQNTVELFLATCPGGPLDQLADLVGRLIQGRDAAIEARRTEDAAARRVAGSAR